MIAKNEKIKMKKSHLSLNIFCIRTPPPFGFSRWFYKKTHSHLLNFLETSFSLPPSERGGLEIMNSFIKIPQRILGAEG